MSKLLDSLKLINAFIETTNPLIGSAIALGASIVADVKASGGNIDDFTTEIARFDAAVNAGLASNDQWRRDHGLS